MADPIPVDRKTLTLLYLRPDLDPMLILRFVKWKSLVSSDHFVPGVERFGHEVLLLDDQYFLDMGKFNDELPGSIFTQLFILLYARLPS